VTQLLGLRDSPPCRPGHILHSVVLYLAPGDYHRFHSPTEWSIVGRRHIAGQLLPVHKLAIKFLPELYTANERVVLYGNWQHGFFSYTAGAVTLLVVLLLLTSVMYFAAAADVGHVFCCCCCCC
jgi:phosphatidylserine decarboxylase precursor